MSEWDAFPAAQSAAPSGGGDEWAAFPAAQQSPGAGYEQARDRWRETVARAQQRPRYQGYGGTVSQMANESFQQMGRGAGQIAEAGRFALSGAGRDVVPDTPANRVAGGFSALEPGAPQAPLTESEHRAANREAIGNVVSGVGNLAQGSLEYLASPISAAIRQPANVVEQTTGVPREYTEFALGLAVPGKLPKLPARQAATPAPSIEALKRVATREGYEGPAVKGLEIKPQEISDWSKVMRSKLDEAGLVDVAESAPGTHAILKRLEAVPPGAAVTGTNIESLRKALRQGPAQSIKGSEREAARRAIEALDEFIPTATAIKGDAKAASQALQEADRNWSRMRLAEMLDKKQYKAELRAGATNSGMNTENSVRSQVEKILTNDKERRGFSPEEIALMERMVYGTGARNTMRAAGNVAGGGGGMLAAGYGLATSGPAAFVPVVGWGLKKISNALAVRDLEKLNELVRANSPLGKRMMGPLQDWSKAAQTFETGPTPRTLASLSIASRNLSNNLADAGIVVDPTALMRSMQGPMRGGAEQEQPDPERVVDQEPRRR